MLKTEEWDSKAITFKLMWKVSHDMITFFGLLSILLTGFFLLDMILTWRQPLRYISDQKRAVPIFVLISKIGQVLLYVILNGAPYPIMYLEICLVFVELIICLAVFISI